MAVNKHANRIREALETDILTGSTATGGRLDEQAIARRFGVSRTPVREALHLLASAGLVEMIPNRGAFVREVSIPELIQMFEVMAEIEAAAGRFAARRATGSAMAEIRDALEGCRAAARRGGPNRYYIENSRFHEAIYDAAANPFLAGEARRLHQRLTAYRRLQLQVPRRMEQSLEEHVAISEAIDTGDEAGAAFLLRNHVAIQGERFGDFVSIVTRSRAAG